MPQVPSWWPPMSVTTLMIKLVLFVCRQHPSCGLSLTVCHSYHALGPNLRSGCHCQCQWPLHVGVCSTGRHGHPLLATKLASRLISLVEGSTTIAAAFQTFQSCVTCQPALAPEHFMNLIRQHCPGHCFIGSKSWPLHSLPARSVATVVDDACLCTCDA